MKGSRPGLCFIGIVLIIANYSTSAAVAPPAGIVRIQAAPASNYTGGALNLLPFDSTLGRVLAFTDLAEGTNAANADLFLLWNNNAAAYDQYYRHADLGGLWVKSPETTETTNTIWPGTGFFILNRDPAATGQVFLAGTMPMDATNILTVPSSLSLISYPYCSAMALSNMALNLQGTAASNQATADTITETVGYNQFWLFDPGADAPYWVTAQTNATDWIAELGDNFWYANQAYFQWEEPCPYAVAAFDADTIPQITGLVLNAELDEATLQISSTGSGQRIEILYKDLNPTTAWNTTSSWAVAYLDLVSSGPSVNWQDEGDGGARAPINTVFGRLYLVGTDLDSDFDGLSDFLESFCLGSDPYGMVAVSGTVSYAGSQTGSIYVLSAPTDVGFPTDLSVTIPAPGAFALNVPEANYQWIKAFVDANADGSVSPCEARGEWAYNPLFLTNTQSGVSVTLEDDTAAPVLSGVPDNDSVETNDVPDPADVTAFDAFEGYVDVAFQETTNWLPDYRLYVGSVTQGLNGYLLTGFTNALQGYGSQRHEPFTDFSSGSCQVLTSEWDDVTCTIELRDDTGTPPYGGTVRSFSIEDPVSQDSATGAGPGIDENSGSTTNRNMFVFSFDTAVGFVTLDGLDVESVSTAVLAVVRAYDIDLNLLATTNIVYPNNETGNQQAHFIGFTSDKCNIGVLTVTVGDTAGTGNSQHLALDNLRFGTAAAIDYQLVRTWSATDTCGQAVAATQMITVVETAAPTLPPFPDPPEDDVWINELHYDNLSIDTNEGVEIAGPADTDLSDYSLIFYSGANGEAYRTVPLSGTIDDEQCGYGAIWFPVAGIENGPADGVALVKNEMDVQYFLSYEGSFTAVDGPAIGLTATNIVKAETVSTPLDQSLQLIGTGATYAAFAWAGPANASLGDLNAGQEHPCPEPPVRGSARYSSNCLEIVDCYVSNSAIMVVASQPKYWSNRIDIFAYDAGDGQAQLGGTTNAWQLVANGLTASGPSNIATFIDTGPFTNLHFYTAGRADIDTDADGLFDSRELLMYHTSPTDADTDADGMPDGWEVGYGLDPLDNGSIDPRNGANGDWDADGADNITEYWQGRNPVLGYELDNGNDIGLTVYTPMER